FRRVLFRSNGAVYDSESNSVLVSDTAERAIISVPVDGSERFAYSGYQFNGSQIKFPLSIVKENDENYIVTDFISGLLRLDMTDGSTTIIADNNTPAENPQFGYNSQIAVDPATSDILLADSRNDQLLSFNPMTGERIVLSDNTKPDTSIPFN